MVLNMLATGVTREDVLEAYPAFEPEDIDACLLYAARLSDLADTNIVVGLVLTHQCPRAAR